MSMTVLVDIISELPLPMRDQIEGYANSIEEAGNDIFRQANIQFDKRLLDELVLILGIRRLWTLVDCQKRLLENSLTAVEREGGEGFTVGGGVLARHSQKTQMLVNLWWKLLEQVEKLGLIRYVTAGSVLDVLRLLSEEERGH